MVCEMALTRHDDESEREEASDERKTVPRRYIFYVDLPPTTPFISTSILSVCTAGTPPVSLHILPLPYEQGSKEVKLIDSAMGRDNE